MPKGKVITALQSRPEVEAALQALARSRTEEESRPYLLALTGLGSAVLPVILHYLDTPDPWMVRALGRALAQFKDRPRAVEALRRITLSRQSSDRQRIVAMVLLDQFLEQPLDESLFAALGNPTEVAVRALLQGIPAEERLVRLDYLSIIHAQTLPDIAHALDRFREAASDMAIAALSFFALDEREAVAEQALEALGAIRRAAALRMLRALEPNVPSPRQALVERMERKLLLSGVPEEPHPQPPASAHVLVSPLDGGGNRLLLVLFPQGGDCRTLHIFLDDEQGVRGAYEVTYGPGEMPRAEGLGTVHPAPHPWEGIFLLEASWGYARWLLREFLIYNEARETLSPLEYRFFFPQIWAWEVAEEEQPPSLEEEILSAQTVSLLLAHPYLASWFLESELIYGAAQTLLPIDLSQPAGQKLLRRVTRSLIRAEFPATACLLYARRLRDMAEWLLRAREEHLAAVAAAAAEEIDAAKPMDSAFAQMLLQKGLLVAVGNLRQAAGLR